MMRVLANMDVWQPCGTPECSGSSGLDFAAQGGLTAFTSCPCGSQSEGASLDDQDVLHLLRSGFYAIQALGALVDACSALLPPASPYHAHIDAMLDDALHKAKHALAVAKVADSGSYQDPR